jgi:hypothetical protein
MPRAELTMFGFAGGAVAGIVIGVLCGVAVLGGAVVVVHRSDWAKVSRDLSCDM